jgi:RNA polymerase sigma factor (sigma-70 family)
MSTSPLNQVIQCLTAGQGPDGGGTTDGELLARFLSSRDHDALAALVRRHAPMVWGVCRRLLHNEHDAEDAFQATFLVLVRKTAGVPERAVANWLYGVARQTAVQLRALSAKRGRREAQVVIMPEPTVAEARDADLQTVLDKELGRLPDRYRGVVVLCDLEGLTRREAARQLGIPEGSVASRLARARAMLARRLARRGLVLPGGSVAAVLSAGPASASAPPELVAATEAVSLPAAGRSAGGVSAKVAALTEGVVKAMVVTRIKGVLAGVLVVAAVAGTAGLYYRSSAAAEPTAKADSLTVMKDRKMGDERQVRAKPPAPPKQQPAKTDQERLVGGWVIVNDDSLRKGEVWEISLDEITMHANLWGFRVARHFHRLDGARSPKQIDLTVTKKNLEPVGVIKGIYSLDDDGELRLCLGEMGKDRPAAFPEKPRPGEVLILHGPPGAKADGAGKGKDNLRVLIDQVLAAHGGEENLNKLQFTMTVKHSNGYTNQYFVQPPKNFRWEQQHRDQTGKMIVILFPEGRRWWTKEPNGEPKEFIPTGAEPKVEYWLDYVKFFGPRQVLRLKDAEHKVARLDEQAKIGDRAAIGVEVTGPTFMFPPSNRKMYFDKETHLLLKSGAITYSDYKTFEGIPIAQKEDDGHFLPEVTAFRVVDKFDAKLFEQP